MKIKLMLLSLLYLVGRLAAANNDSSLALAHHALTNLNQVPPVPPVPDAGYQLSRVLSQVYNTYPETEFSDDDSDDELLEQGEVLQEEFKNKYPPSLGVPYKRFLQSNDGIFGKLKQDNPEKGKFTFEISDELIESKDDFDKIQQKVFKRFFGIGSAKFEYDKEGTMKVVFIPSKDNALSIEEEKSGHKGEVSFWYHSENEADTFFLNRNLETQVLQYEGNKIVGINQDGVIIREVLKIIFKPGEIAEIDHHVLDYKSSCWFHFEVQANQTGIIDIADCSNEIEQRTKHGEITALPKNDKEFKEQLHKQVKLLTEELNNCITALNSKLDSFSESNKTITNDFEKINDELNGIGNSIKKLTEELDFSSLTKTQKSLLSYMEEIHSRIMNNTSLWNNDTLWDQNKSFRRTFKESQDEIKEKINQLKSSYSNNINSWLIGYIVASSLCNLIFIALFIYKNMLKNKDDKSIELSNTKEIL